MKRNLSFYKSWDNITMTANSKSEMVSEGTSYFMGYDFLFINGNGLYVFVRRPWIVKFSMKLFRFYLCEKENSQCFSMSDEFLYK